MQRFGVKISIVRVAYIVPAQVANALENLQVKRKVGYMKELYIADENRYNKMNYNRCGNSGLKLPQVS